MSILKFSLVTLNSLLLAPAWANELPPPPPAAPQSEVVASQGGHQGYRGYALDLSALAKRPDATLVRRAAEHQIDLVEATPLDGTTKDLFRNVLVVVKPGSGKGSHYDGENAITIAVDDPNDDRPILLHEFMHVYHQKCLPGGVHNADVLEFYGRALANKLYSPEAYLIDNPKEFFAMTATVYLRGRQAREPYTREELQSKQPKYYDYLGSIFNKKPK